MHEHVAAFGMASTSEICSFKFHTGYVDGTVLLMFGRIFALKDAVQSCACCNNLLMKPASLCDLIAFAARDSTLSPTSPFIALQH
jgi:hypothetical protein